MRAASGWGFEVHTLQLQLQQALRRYLHHWADSLFPTTVHYENLCVFTEGRGSKLGCHPLVLVYGMEYREVVLFRIGGQRVLAGCVFDGLFAVCYGRSLGVMTDNILISFDQASTSESPISAWELAARCVFDCLLPERQV